MSLGVLCSLLSEEFEKNGVNSSLIICRLYQWSHLVLDFSLTTDSVFLLVMRNLDSLFLHESVLVDCMFLEVYPFSITTYNLLVIIVKIVVSPSFLLLWHQFISFLSLLILFFIYSNLLFFCSLAKSWSELNSSSCLISSCCFSIFHFCSNFNIFLLPTLSLVCSYNYSLKFWVIYLRLFLFYCIPLSP